MGGGTPRWAVPSAPSPQTRPVRPAPDGWPDQMEAAGGECGEALAQASRYEETAGGHQRTANEYDRQRGEYDRVVMAAKPGCDLAAVAAAREGVSVYQVAAVEAGRQAGEADGAARVLADRAAAAWDRARHLRRQLRGEEPRELASSSFDKRTDDALKAEIRQLIGLEQ